MATTRALGITAFTLCAACASAHADRIAVQPEQKPAQVLGSTSPYSVDLIDQSGHALDVYQQRGRFYVLGQQGQRYSIRVKNPTARRVEAVVSVDGLDVIDGKSADFKSKRGYVVPAYGELKIDGFRVSTSHVAAFRFSSVRNSYAGRKGKARNVGVIGVAIFEEKKQPEIIVHEHRPPPHPRPYPRKDVDRNLESEDSGDFDDAPAPPAEPARGGASADKPASTGSAGSTRGAPAPRDFRTTVRRRERCCTKKKERPGLGTEFGERRWSAVSFTRFERANASVPSAMATLRYNDRDGLAALGIRLAPQPDPEELHLRETADPFPANGFAAPPTGWR
jgi:hypothetical protein